MRSTSCDTKRIWQENLDDKQQQHIAGRLRLRDPMHRPQPQLHRQGVRPRGSRRRYSRGVHDLGLLHDPWITGHGIKRATQERVLEQARRFLGPDGELGPAGKEALHMKQIALHRGLEPHTATSAVAGEAETKEAFNWGWEERLWDGCQDAGGCVELDGEQYEEGAANLWPREEDMPGFFEGVREYYAAAMELARNLVGLFDVALGLEDGFIDSVITHPGGFGKLIYYAPGKQEGLVDEQDGLGAHSDFECCECANVQQTRTAEDIADACTSHDLAAVRDTRT